MRASERNAFLRECESAHILYELERIASSILACFNLEKYASCFIESADGLALLANCCNYAAKRHNYGFYQYKPMLIVLACEHAEAIYWQSEGVVYIETSIGQVSFHALYGEDKDLPEAQGRTWSQIEYQMHAELVANAWLDGMSLTTLHQKIARLEQERSSERQHYLEQCLLEECEQERAA